MSLVSTRCSHGNADKRYVFEFVIYVCHFFLKTGGKKNPIKLAFCSGSSKCGFIETKRKVRLAK